LSISTWRTWVDPIQTSTDGLNAELI
jgi:hypothetical protein